MTAITKEALLTLLASNECVVEFTKVNGEKRTMPCTLKSDIVPPTPVVEGKEPKKKNPNVVSVWCLDKKEWRSFRLDNLISVAVK